MIENVVDYEAFRVSVFRVASSHCQVRLGRFGVIYRVGFDNVQIFRANNPGGFYFVDDPRILSFNNDRITRFQGVYAAEVRAVSTPVRGYRKVTDLAWHSGIKIMPCRASV